jgi:hypothetical protein
LLLGRRVRATNGRVIGRLEEFHAEIDGKDCYLTEFLVGTYALFERLAAWPIIRSLLRVGRAKKGKGGYYVRWDQLDVSNPTRPYLRCSVDELLPIERDGESAR